MYILKKIVLEQKLTVVVVNSRMDLMNLTKEEAQAQILHYSEADYPLLHFLWKRVVSYFHEPSCSVGRQDISQ